MPFCPRCDAEYQTGIETCADCGEALTDQPPTAPPVGTPTREVAVGRFGSEIEAQMWAELLRGQGIPSRTLEYLGDLVAFGGQETSPHLLLVRASDAERARTALSDVGATG